MKKTFTKILSLVLSCIMAFAPTACTTSDAGGGNHSHAFNCTVTTDAYLKSEATCESAKKYYYSCSCGIKGEEFFTQGSPLPHAYTAEVATDAYLKTPATCTSLAVYYKSCISCGIKGEDLFSSGVKLSHTFTAQTATDDYLKTPASCTEEAVYYNSCSSCGEAGEETFSYGSTLSHDYTEKVETQYLKTPASCTEEAVYYKSCEDCGEKGNETFTYGATLSHNYLENPETQYLKTPASCTEEAVYYKSCKDCGEKGNETFSFGTTLLHNCVAEVVDEQYLKTPATCSAVAVYYKSCKDCGAIGSETFTYGAIINHDSNAEVVADKYFKEGANCEHGLVYYKSCSMCGLISEETFISGSPAHEFTNKIVDDKYLKSTATCSSGALYYKSCSKCGEAGEETFVDGKKVSHDYSAQVASDEYLKTPANCLQPAIYCKSCTMCGKARLTSTFEYGEPSNDHKFTSEVAEIKYLKEDATTEKCATYYKSCEDCGAVGEEFFEHGTPLKVYDDLEKIPYTPTSLTLTLFDAQNNIYGFTYNTKSKPLRPVIQIEKGTEFTDLREEHPLSVSEETSYDAEGIFFIYYVVKGEVQLDINSTYIYRAYDKYVDVGSEEVILNTKNPKSTKFTFAHVSDSQMSANDNSGAGSGVYFAQTLSQLTQNSDIIVHTGDVVQYAQYEGYWEAMLHDNFRYLSQIPMMAISGNHEVSYSSGLKETYKHFNYKLPEQTSVNKGIFYSFVYGNVKFIMLNTNDLIGTELKTEQYEWLENELKNNTATWTVVAMHNPMYSVGKWGANPEQNATSLGLRAQLQGLFAKYKVDLVLQGHDHAISRTYPIDEKGVPQREITFTDKNVEYTSNPNGVIYVMNGPAGNQARSPYATDDNLYKYQQSSQTRSWAEFEVDGNRIVVSVKYTDGMNTFMYQKWGIEKIV